MRRSRCAVADAHQFLIGDFQINFPHLGLRHTGHPGCNRRESPPGDELRGCQDRVALDQGVAEEAGGNFFHITRQECALQQVLDRVVNTIAIGKGATGQIGNCFAGSAPDIVGDTGAKADLHSKIETGGQGAVDAPGLDDRVTEGAGCSQLQVSLPQCRINSIHIDGTDLIDRKEQKMFNLALDPFAAGVTDSVFEGNFYSVGHITQVLFP